MMDEDFEAKIDGEVSSGEFSGRDSTKRDDIGGDNIGGSQINVNLPADEMRAQMYAALVKLVHETGKQGTKLEMVAENTERIRKIIDGNGSPNIVSRIENIEEDVSALQTCQARLVDMRVTARMERIILGFLITISIIFSGVAGWVIIRHVQSTIGG